RCSPFISTARIGVPGPAMCVQAIIPQRAGGTVTSCLKTRTCRASEVAGAMTPRLAAADGGLARNLLSHSLGNTSALLAELTSGPCKVGPHGCLGRATDHQSSTRGSTMSKLFPRPLSSAVLTAAAVCVAAPAHADQTV